MANVVLNNDPSTGHPGCAPVNAIASSLVTINGIKIVVNNDSYTPHCNHQGHVIASSKVTINGKTIALHGDSLDCGDTATATSLVTIN